MLRETAFRGDEVDAVERLTRWSEHVSRSVCPVHVDNGEACDALALVRVLHLGAVRVCLTENGPPRCRGRRA